MDHLRPQSPGCIGPKICETEGPTQNRNRERDFTSWTRLIMPQSRSEIWEERLGAREWKPGSEQHPPAVQKWTQTSQRRRSQSTRWLIGTLPSPKSSETSALSTTSVSSPSPASPSPSATSPVRLFFSTLSSHSCFFFVQSIRWRRNTRKKINKMESFCVFLSLF